MADRQQPEGTADRYRRISKAARNNEDDTSSFQSLPLTKRRPRQPRKIFKTPDQHSIASMPTASTAHTDQVQQQNRMEQRGYVTDDPARHRNILTPAPQNRPTDTPSAAPANNSVQQAKLIAELMQQNKELNLKLERMEKLLTASMPLQTGHNNANSQRSALSITPDNPNQNGSAAENIQL